MEFAIIFKDCQDIVLLIKGKMSGRVVFDKIFIKKHGVRARRKEREKK